MTNDNGYNGTLVIHGLPGSVLKYQPRIDNERSNRNSASKRHRFAIYASKYMLFKVINLINSYKHVVLK